MNDLPTLTRSQLHDAQALDLCRFIKCHHQTRTSAGAAELFLTEHPRSVSASLVRQALEWHEKSSVAAGNTSDASWAAPLVNVRPLFDAFVSVVRPREVLSQLIGTLPVPVQTPIPLWTPTTTPAVVWIGQGAPKSVAAFSFTTTSLPPGKLALIVVVTKELLQVGANTERTLRDILAKQIIDASNTELLDPTKAPVADVSPGSLTNAGTSVAPTGTSAGDAAAVLAALIDARPDVANPTLILPPAAALELIATGNHPDLRLTGGTAFGAQTIVTGAAGTTISALDPTAVLVWDGGLELDLSNRASIVMDSVPTSDAAAIVTSLWQQNFVGFRCERFVSWKLTDPEAVHYATAA